MRKSKRLQLSILSTRGIGIVEILIGSTLLVLIFWLFGMLYSRSEKALSELHEKHLAHTFSVELLERFRSLTHLELRRYLRVNPVDGAQPPYSLCAHINILDRSTDTLINPDPLATLPLSILDRGIASLGANRYFQVQVINIEEPNELNLWPTATMGDVSTNPTALTRNCTNANQCLCAYNFSEICFNNQNSLATCSEGGPGLVKLNANQRFMISVGLTWATSREAQKPLESVFLSSVLPGFQDE